MSKNKLLIITVTHERPQAFAALEKWVKAQTFKNYDWLVVTDGDLSGYKFKHKQKVVERETSLDDILPSICHNYLEAMKHVEGYEKIVFMEDDDYYASDFLYEMDELLDQADLAGFYNDAYYYVLHRRAKRWGNVGGASLAATGITQKVVPWFIKCCEKGDPFIDKWLWHSGVTQEEKPNIDGRLIYVKHAVEHWRGSRILVDNFTGLKEGELPKIDKNGNITPPPAPRHVGMKENWHGGTGGISEFGHSPDGAYDLWGKTLEKWIGEDDARFYLKFTKPNEYGSPAMTGVFCSDPKYDPTK